MRIKRHNRIQIMEARRKYINKRVKLIKDTWYDGEYYLENLDSMGHFSKDNLVCSCDMCRDTKYREERHKNKFNYRFYQED